MENHVIKEEAEAYKSFVGPADRYDFLGASQFCLLFTLGLQPDYHLLDFGCGSLRAGRFLITYLNKGCYHGIEPNKWLVDEGIRTQTGQDLINLKEPHFSHNDDFTLGQFSGEKFDFIIAQSIFSHTGTDLLRKCLNNLGAALSPEGLLVATFVEGSTDFTGSEWIYPEVITLRRSTIKQYAREAGLFSTPIPWYRPFQTWHVLAKSAQRLPSRQMYPYLKGAVLNDPQTYESWRTGDRMIYWLRKAFRRNAPLKLQEKVITLISNLRNPDRK